MSAIHYEAGRIDGSLKCMGALRNLERDSLLGELDQSITDFYGQRLTNVSAFVAALGPMSPEMEGIIATMAEYIHSVMTGGTILDIDPGRWLPLVAMTECERRAMIDRFEERAAAS